MKLAHTYWIEEGVGALSLCGQARRTEKKPSKRPTCGNCRRIILARGWLKLHRRPSRIKERSEP